MTTPNTESNSDQRPSNMEAKPKRKPKPRKWQKAKEMREKKRNGKEQQPKRQVYVHPMYGPMIEVAKNCWVQLHVHKRMQKQHATGRRAH